jgi:hypothetical protein
MIYCACSSTLILLQSYTSKEVQDSAYRGAIIVFWLHETVAQVAKPYISYELTLVYEECGWFILLWATLANRTVNTILKTCHFRWQCPVRRPTTHLNWLLFNFDSSLVLLAEGSLLVWVILRILNIFDDFCLSSPWSLSWQLLLRCRKLVQVLQTDIWIPILPVGRPFRYQQCPRDPLPISLKLRCVWPVALSDCKLAVHFSSGSQKLT